MIDIIEILQHCECRHFGLHSCEEPFCSLCIVSYHHELVVELGENRFDPFSELLVSPGLWSPVLLVQPVGNFKCDVCRLKQVQLYRCTKISLVPEYRTVVIFPPYILKIMQVMHIGGRQIIGMDDTAHSAECMELVTIVMHVLRGTIAPGWCMFKVIISHCAPLSTCVLTDPYRFGVYAEDKFTPVHDLGNGFAYLLSKSHGQLATLVILSATYQIGDSVGALFVHTIEKIVLAVDTERLCCDGKCNHLQIGESRNNTTADYVSFIVYQISCIFFAYVKNFSEICNEVVHSTMIIVLNSFITPKLIKIIDMCNFFIIIILTN